MQAQNSLPSSRKLSVMTEMHSVHTWPKVNTEPVWKWGKKCKLQQKHCNDNKWKCESVFLEFAWFLIWLLWDFYSLANWYLWNVLIFRFASSFSRRASWWNVALAINWRQFILISRLLWCQTNVAWNRHWIRYVKGFPSLGILGLYSWIGIRMIWWGHWPSVWFLGI